MIPDLAAAGFYHRSDIVFFIIGRNQNTDSFHECLLSLSFFTGHLDGKLFVLRRRIFIGA
jgi:hypothetical protein